MEREGGLINLNDPVDTTSAQGRLIEGKLSVREICEQLGIAKPTLYFCLKQCGVKTGRGG